MDASTSESLSVSRETNEKLQVFSDLLIKWNRSINLISKSTANDLWHRHITDSLQIAKLIDSKDLKWVDIGSGGGLPGVIVAIAAADIAPEMDVILIESDARKCAFLREASRQTDARFKVLNSRIEAAPPQAADVVSARALASMDKLLEYASLHLAQNGRCLFNKGETFQDELALARQKWKFVADIQPSVTNPKGVIVTVKELERG